MRATYETELASLLHADAERMRLLSIAAGLDLPDCWIGAGLVRSAAWDRLHGRPPAASWGDVDIVWFDRARTEVDIDAQAEAHLRKIDPSVNWSVRNQARMHARNGDAPYTSTRDAIAHWPETATSIAARRKGDSVEILSPHGLHDLFALTLRPTPSFATEKRSIFQRRVQEKRWLEHWPLLRIAQD